VFSSVGVSVGVTLVWLHWSVYPLSGVFGSDRHHPRPRLNAGCAGWCGSSAFASSRRRSA